MSISWTNDGPGGESLLDWLGARLPDRDPLDLVKRGKIRSFGNIIGLKYILKKGDKITYAEDFQEPKVCTDYQIISEKARILAVFKPADLPVHPSGAYLHNTLLGLLEGKYGRLFPLHRLDRETSGVILLARDSEIAGRWSKALEKAEKTYICLVKGDFPLKAKVNEPIGPALRSDIKIKQGVRPDGRASLTLFRRICIKNSHSLLFARPQSGRMHQIRVHLKHLGFSLAGDKIYGPDERYYLDFIEKGLTPELLSALGSPRHLLQLWKLRISDPDSGVRLHFKVSLDRDFESFLGKFTV